MFFKKKSSDMSEIKQAVGEEYESVEELPTFEEKEAPLFVKVEKYRNIISTLTEMKAFIAGIKQLYSVLHEAETVKNDTLKILRSSVQRLEKSIYELDSEMLRPRGFVDETKETQTEFSHIEGSLSDLQRQLAMLKKELQQIQ